MKASLRWILAACSRTDFTDMWWKWDEEKWDRRGWKDRVEVDGTGRERWETYIRSDVAFLSCQKKEINTLKTFDIWIESSRVLSIYLSQKYDIARVHLAYTVQIKFTRIENNRQRYTRRQWEPRPTRSRIENRRILLSWILTSSKLLNLYVLPFFKRSLGRNQWIERSFLWGHTRNVRALQGKKNKMRHREPSSYV